MIGYAYLHGFASGPRSKKGTALAAAFAARAVYLALPDLNRPSFAELTLTAQLAALDALTASRPDVTTWRFIGSSMGGWVAARWAELHPDRVDRLVLLCPGFDMIARWPKLLGSDAMARWRAHGALVFPSGDKRPEAVHWGFIEDALTLPATPEVPCPTLIVHGTRDATVPIDTSRAYAAARATTVTLVEVDDNHELTRSLGLVEDQVARFFELPPAA